MNVATFYNSRFLELGFPWGAAARESLRIPGAAPPGSLAPWRAAPSKLLAPWRLRPKTLPMGDAHPNHCNGFAP